MKQTHFTSRAGLSIAVGAVLLMTLHACGGGGTSSNDARESVAAVISGVQTCAPGMSNCPPDQSVKINQISQFEKPMALTSPTSCSVVGSWTEAFGGQITVNPNLTGSIKLPYCNSAHSLAVTLNGTAGFSVQASWSGGSECVAFTENMSFGSTCATASGSYINQGGGSGIDTWTRIKPDFSIVSPGDQEQSSLTEGNFTSTPVVSYRADTGSGNQNVSVLWQTTLEYKTSGGRGATSTTASFQTIGNGTTDRTYSSSGGRQTIKASATINGSSKSAEPVTIYITGTSIPNSTITDRLVTLYGGTTPNLMTGIADRESSYRHFSTRTLYGFSAMWPLEAYDGGSHVGLMMMPVSQTSAWDWLVNTQSGVSLFSDKLATALRLENRIIAQHSGLRALTSTERENMALVLYGPHASASLSEQYYIPQQVGNGPTWQWVVNSAGNAGGVAYATSVRLHVH